VYTSASRTELRQDNQPISQGSNGKTWGEDRFLRTIILEITTESTCSVASAGYSSNKIAESWDTPAVWSAKPKPQQHGRCSATQTYRWVQESPCQPVMVSWVQRGIRKHTTSDCCSGCPQKMLDGGELSCYCATPTERGKGDTPARNKSPPGGIGRKYGANSDLIICIRAAPTLQRVCDNQSTWSLMS
jgi:hypothetical protein